jgi:ribonucleoside-diphosphate reductase alpha chain
MIGKELVSNLKFNESYAKYKKEEGRLETWEEACKDVMSMHYNKFSVLPNWNEIEPYFQSAEQAYINQEILASQRNLQFREKSILKHNCKLYNCSVTYVDRPEVFKEIMWVLLCGAGVGFSVENRYIDKLPKIHKRNNIAPIVHIIEDSIEGWAIAIDKLMESYFYGGQKVIFDYSLIRERGALIAGEFLAPGPEGLKKSLDLLEKILDNKVNNNDNKLTSLDCHDIICILSDAVLSGGVRRSALISLFDKDDELMLNCKTENWHLESEQPWRARANNSAKILKGSLTKEELDSYKEFIKQFGEPGVLLVDDIRMMCNPCVEIGFIPINPINGKSCWSFCNLNEIIGSHCTTKEKFYEACKNAAILGTFQASYTDFSFLGPDTEELVRWEALLGVSITGIMNNTNILLDPEILQEGARIVKETNEIVAKLIGINQSARTTCVKPSGNASVLTKTASGIHPAHSYNYFRTVQLNKDTPMAKYLNENYPELLEEGVWSPTNTDYACFIPMEEEPETIVKSQIDEIEFLQAVQTVYKYWVLEGTNKHIGYSDTITHNVSNTVSVKDWDKTFDYIFENKEYFCGISFLPDFGDKIYKQAPFVEVLTLNELITKYDNATIFASGLIVDALHSFNNDLWDACSAVTDREFILTGDRITVMVKKDIVLRIKKFSKNYFKGNLSKAIDCLKDIYLYHKWVKINRVLKNKPVDFNKINYTEKYLQADELSGVSCNGGACEVNF